MFDKVWPFVGSALPVGIDVQVESIDSISEVNMVRASDILRVPLALRDFWTCAVCFALVCRTSPWRCTWGITGRTTGWPSPPAATRVVPLMPVWSKRSGFLTCSSSTLSAPSSMTQPWRTSCCGYILMATSSTVSGKKQIWAFIFFLIKQMSVWNHLVNQKQEIGICLSTL